MKEAEWLACEDPLRMLQSAHRRQRCRTGERIWRLLACAAARRIWAGFSAPCRRAVEVAERFADGLATAEEMLSADMDTLRNQHLRCRGFGAARWTLWGPWRGYDTLFKAVTAGLEQAGKPTYQCGLIRDIFGNPFRPVRVEEAWLRWNDGGIPKMAQVLYDDRDLPSGTLDVARMGILADALEEAGCGDAQILDHLRATAPHVRGCFVIDFLLGKA